MVKELWRWIVSLTVYKDAFTYKVPARLPIPRTAGKPRDSNVYVPWWLVFSSEAFPMSNKRWKIVIPRNKHLLLLWSAKLPKCFILFYFNIANYICHIYNYIPLLPVKCNIVYCIKAGADIPYTALTFRLLKQKRKFWSTVKKNIF